MQHPTTETLRPTWRQVVARLWRRKRVRKLLLRGLALLAGAGLAWSCEFFPEGAPQLICRQLSALAGALGGQ